MNKPSFRIGSALLLLAAGAGFASAAGGAPGDNLVSNPGFEDARWNAPAAWRLSEGAQGNTFDWTAGSQAGSEVHSGDRSLRMNALRQPAPERSMDATTNLFRVSPHARVEASVWLKASDVTTQEDTGGYGLRVTLTAQRLRRQDRASRPDERAGLLFLEEDPGRHDRSGGDGDHGPVHQVDDLHRHRLDR